MAIQTEQIARVLPFVRTEKEKTAIAAWRDYECIRRNFPMPVHGIAKLEPG